MSKPGQNLLWFAPVPIVIAVFLASLPWLKDLDDTLVLVISGAVAAFVMGWAFFLSKRFERSLDEVQRAGHFFASQRGAVIGSFVTPLLLLITPLTDRAIDFLIALSSDTPGVPDRDTMVLAMVFGFMLLIVMQLLGTVIANAVWNRRLSGRP